MSATRGWWMTAALVLAGCAATRLDAAQAPSREAAEAALAQLTADEPQTFKMTHQVVARFQGQTYPMGGYLLGRSDGSFRVSATAVVGPKLFDVARLSGHWDSKVYLPEVAARLDPLEVGHAIERIYFLGARGPLLFEQGAWVTRQTIDGGNADTIEVWRGADDLQVVRKRFLRHDRQVLEITYEQRDLVRGQSVARRIVFSDARGFTLELLLTDYQAGVPVPDERLRLGP